MAAMMAIASICTAEQNRRTGRDEPLSDTGRPMSMDWQSVWIPICLILIRWLWTGVQAPRLTITPIMVGLRKHGSSRR